MSQILTLCLCLHNLEQDIEVDVELAARTKSKRLVDERDFHRRFRSPSQGIRILQATPKPDPRDVLERLTAVGGGGVTPPPLAPS